MSGIHDGVSKVWMLSIDRGLNIDGFKNKEDMLRSLIHRVLSDGYKDPDLAVGRLTGVVDECVAAFRKDYETENK